MTAVMIYQRADWTDFRTLETLTRKAGVPRDKLARLVVKELVDNALDAGLNCRCGLADDGVLYVEDDGPGVPGTDEAVAGLFSVGRPLTSSKLMRRPTRGALGNGLRVVAGAVLASGGSLTVRTKGRSLRLVPRDDGATTVAEATPWDGTGTRIEVRLGPDLPVDRAAFVWASRAVALAGRGKGYAGRSSPHWFTDESFWELLQAAGDNTVRALTAELDGCGGRKARDVAAPYKGRTCADLTRDEAADLLKAARAVAKPVDPRRLGVVGPLDEFDGYCKKAGLYTIGGCDNCALIPFVVEAWAVRADRPAVEVCVNRSPVTADVGVHRDAEARTDYLVWGCNLVHTFRVGRGQDFRLLVNIQAPYLPLTTDGKEPDLAPFADPIANALKSATRQARHIGPERGGAVGVSHKAVVERGLDDAIASASGGGKYRYSLRQLFYSLRPALIEKLGAEPRYGTFCGVIGDIEAARGGDLPGMYRDTRGTLYHPHLGQWIPIGTLSVEDYSRPAWTFNKILYCEKEGLFPALIDARWPERNDCALLTSKGYATRAARDTLDLLGDGGEPLTFSCIHDADGPGTLIYQSLVEETQARPGRKVDVVNLGLDVEQAWEMGLAAEVVRRKDGRCVPVADYVSDEAREWLQGHRVELNAMSTPQLLAWLDARMAGHAGKLVPPAPVLRARLQDDVRSLVRNRLVDSILREGRLDARVDVEVAALAGVVEDRGRVLHGEVDEALGRTPEDSWRTVVGRVADEVVNGEKPAGG